MSTYVVGDIQGCFEPFQCLLKKVDFNPDKDRLWSVGDLVNRGPGNLETLRWFYAHRDNVTMVLGNHDLHLMAVSCGARKPSRKDNLDDILDAPDREQLIEWLHFQPLAHAGLALAACFADAQHDQPQAGAGPLPPVHPRRVIAYRQPWRQKGAASWNAAALGRSEL